MSRRGLQFLEFVRGMMLVINPVVLRDFGELKSLARRSFRSCQRLGCRPRRVFDNTDMRGAVREHSQWHSAIEDRRQIVSEIWSNIDSSRECEYLCAAFSLHDSLLIRL